MGFTIAYTSVTWTTGDIITEAKLDNMVANDQAYDAHTAQGLQLDEMTAPSTPSSGKVRIYAKTDGNIYQKDDAGTETSLAGGGTSGLIGARITLSGADQTLNNGSATQIQYGTEVYDTGSAYNTGTYTFTVPSGKAGYYVVYNALYLYSALTVGNQFKSMIYVNGAEVGEGQLVCAATNTGETAQNTYKNHLAVGDTVTWYGFSPQANTKVYNPTTHSWGDIQQMTQD